jgi:hypothetical protein
MTRGIPFRGTCPHFVLPRAADTEPDASAFPF